MEIMSQVRQVLEMTSRIDERVKGIAHDQEDMSERLNRLVDQHNILLARVSVLESSNVVERMQEEIEEIMEMVSKMDKQMVVLELRHNLSVDHAQRLGILENKSFLNEERSDTMAARVKQYVGLFLQFLWIIGTGYILYKLGINSPVTPP